MTPDTVKKDIESLLGYYALLLDDSTTADALYIGKARTGSPTSSEVWQIKKIDTTTGLIVTWADGDPLFNNVWDNRATLTYA